MPKQTPQFLTIVDLLRYRAIHQANNTAFTFLENGEIEAGKLTYQELDRQARIIATHLLNWQGERALLLYPAGLEFITAFFGCLYAGVIAVPAYPPRRNQKLSRLISIVNNAEAKVALTTRSKLNEINKWWQKKVELARLNLVVTDAIKAANYQEFVPQLIIPKSLAFLQYTSGSTGTPKGVMITHENIIHNQQSIYQAFGHTERTIFVGWLPLFHDMGLIGNILQPIYLGIPCIFMPSVAFLQKPIRWLQAISRYGATTSGGPNFAYELCVSKIKPEQLATLNLNSWEVAFTGAETVRAHTLERFNKLTAACGFRKEAFYPCYGMAETTLFISGGFKAETPIISFIKETELLHNRVVHTIDSSKDSQAIVSCGRSWLDHKIMIVHPKSLLTCGHGEVGEIWVSGSSVAQGYWRCTEQTQQTFQAHVADTGEGPFLRTGDLGFLQNTELFVTGRIKDVIIIRGQNHYPQDIELTVQNSHLGLRYDCGAAFSLDIKGEEKLVIIQEVERTYRRKLDIEKVINNITEALTAQHGLQVYAIVLVNTGSILKTSSGKIQRQACKTAFLNGSLNILREWSEDSWQKSNFRHLQTDVKSLLGKMQPDKQP